MMRASIYNQKTALGIIYSRNQLMLANTDIPQKTMLAGKLYSLDSIQIQPKELFDTKSIHELLCVYLLGKVQYKIEDNQVSLGGLLRRDPAGAGTLIQQIRSEPEQVLDIVPLEFKQSKRNFGIQGDVFYADWTGVDVTQLFADCLDIMLGLDEVGQLVDSITADNFCPNIIDIVTANVFNQLVEVLCKSPTKYTSLQAYFACRGMRYLNQSVTLKKGVACGVSGHSYIMQTLPAVVHAQSRQFIEMRSQKYDNWDMVVLNGTNHKIIYFTPDDCKEYLEAVQFKVDCSNHVDFAKYRGIPFILS